MANPVPRAGQARDASTQASRLRICTRQNSHLPGLVVVPINLEDRAFYERFRTATAESAQHAWSREPLCLGQRNKSGWMISLFSKIEASPRGLAVRRLVGPQVAFSGSGVFYLRRGDHLVA